MPFAMSAHSNQPAQPLTGQLSVWPVSSASDQPAQPLTSQLSLWLASSASDQPAQPLTSQLSLWPASSASEQSAQLLTSQLSLWSLLYVHHSYNYYSRSMAKLNKITFAPSEDPDQPRHPPGLIRSLWCPQDETLRPQLPTESTAKTLIRLGGCPGWSVFAGCIDQFEGFVMRRLNYYFVLWGQWTIKVLICNFVHIWHKQVFHDTTHCTFSISVTC